MISSLAFGVMAFVAKRATLRLPGAEVALVRFLVGAAAIAVAVACGVRLRPHNWIGIGLRGLFGGLAVLGYFIAIERLSVGTATLLNYTFPIFTAIFAALFLGERVRPATAIALLVTFVGVVMVLQGNAGAGRIGFGVWEAVGLLAAVLSGAAVTTIRAVRRTEGSWEIFAGFCVVGALVTAPMALASWVAPSRVEWALLVTVGLISVLAQLLLTYAMRFVAAAPTGVIIQLVPVTALLLGVVLLGEPAHPIALLGAGLTLAGVAWGARGDAMLRR